MYKMILAFIGSLFFLTTAVADFGTTFSTEGASLNHAVLLFKAELQTEESPESTMIELDAAMSDDENDFYRVSAKFSGGMLCYVPMKAPKDGSTPHAPDHETPLCKNAEINCKSPADQTEYIIDSLTIKPVKANVGAVTSYKAIVKVADKTMEELNCSANSEIAIGVDQMTSSSGQVVYQKPISPNERAHFMVSIDKNQEVTLVANSLPCMGRFSSQPMKLECQ